MPFKSTAQRAFLAIHKPKIAREFAAMTPKGVKLQEHVAHVNKMLGTEKK